MLIERASTVIRKIEELDRLGADKEQFEKSRTRHRALSQLLTDMEPLLRTCELFENHGLKLALNVDYIAPMKSRLGQLSTKFNENRFSILDPDPEMKFNFWDRLKELPTKVKDALLKQWGEHVASLSPALNLEILDVLGKTSLKRQIDNIFQILRQMETLSKSLPDSKADFNTARELGSSLHSLWNNLEGDNIPVDVLELLKKATSAEGASLELLTEKARNWLSERKIMDNLRLKIYESRS